MPANRSAEGDYVISETGNWNVADMFSKVKIMKPLENCDLYEDIAMYGHDSFFQELIYAEVGTEELKFRGLKRLINELIKLAKNARFAMRREKTKEDLKKFEEKLFKIKNEILPKTTKAFKDDSQNISGMRLIEPLFTKTLEVVSEIKSDINIPLNKNHLIFTDKEEFDPIAFKNRIKARMMEQG